MLPVKTDKDIIRNLREALRIQEHNTNNIADKYCRLYKKYKAYVTGIDISVDGGWTAW